MAVAAAAVGSVKKSKGKVDRDTILRTQVRIMLIASPTLCCIWIVGIELNCSVGVGIYY
jgi:hypothetical protein